MNWFFSSFTALVLVVITAIVFYSCIILFYAPLWAAQLFQDVSL